MQNQVIIEAPNNLGLKQLRDIEPGVRKLPAWLKRHGLYEVLKPQKVVQVKPPPYRMHLDEASGVLNADTVIEYSKDLSNTITTALDAGSFPWVIGGDCSILIGCALALKSRGDFGLIYLDGHHDFVLPQQSQTKAVAGMALALVTGNGPDKLVNINSLKPYFNEYSVFAIGNRCLEPDYVQLITDSDINYYDLDALRAEGIQNIAKQFLNTATHLDGFWIHLDVDVLDNALMPCVDSPQLGGLSYPELVSVFKILLSSPKVKGVNVTILDPDLDRNGLYTKGLIADFFMQIS